MKLYIKKEDITKVLNDKMLNAELLSANCRRITLSFFSFFNSAFDYLKDLLFTLVAKNCVVIIRC